MFLVFLHRIRQIKTKEKFCTINGLNADLINEPQTVELPPLRFRFVSTFDFSREIHNIERYENAKHAK